MVGNEFSHCHYTLFNNFLSLLENFSRLCYSFLSLHMLSNLTFKNVEECVI